MHTMDLCHSINYMLTEGSGNVNGLVTIQLIEWGGGDLAMDATFN